MNQDKISFFRCEVSCRVQLMNQPVLIDFFIFLLHKHRIRHYMSRLKYKAQRCSCYQMHEYEHRKGKPNRKIKEVDGSPYHHRMIDDLSKGHDSQMRIKVFSAFD